MVIIYWFVVVDGVIFASTRSMKYWAMWGLQTSTTVSRGAGCQPDGGAVGVHRDGSTATCGAFLDFEERRPGFT